MNEQDRLAMEQDQAPTSVTPSAARDQLLELLFQAIADASPQLQRYLRAAFDSYASSDAWQQGKQDHRLVLELMGHIGAALGSTVRRKRPQFVQECPPNTTCDEVPMAKRLERARDAIEEADHRW